MSACHPAADRLPLGPATATGPAPLAGGNGGPPVTGWTVTAPADPLPPGPSSAEVAAVRALPLGARRALCACSGPGWTIFAEGPAVPRLAPPSAELVGAGCEAWLPADATVILDAAISAFVPRDGIGVPVEWEAWTRSEPSGRVHRQVQLLADGWVRHITAGRTMREAALSMLAWTVAP